MRRLLLVSCLLLGISAGAQVYNREPLEGSLYAELPLGAIKPEGWLREQLQRQARGLTGHLDQVYPEVMGPTNAWLGGDGDAWERGPYWIDGLLPLAYLLDDEALKAKAQAWVEAILDSQQENGYFGPVEDHPYVYGLQRGQSHDWWPKMVALKILKQYYLATGDPRIPDALSRYFHYQRTTLPDQPLDHWTSWGKERGADNLEVVYWLYNLSGEEELLALGDLLHSQTTDWASLFREGDLFAKQGSVHSVNLAQGFKAPVVWWQFSHWDGDRMAPRRAQELIKGSVGLPTGLWAGDEQLQFGHPSRGSELCAAVEMMFSLEEMLRLSGDNCWADWLERIAFNALPTQIKDDFSAKQYYQQTNQIACTHQIRPFSTPHDGTDTMFGTLNGYPCCLSNMHQGWPKFTQNLWYTTSDGGLAALVYAPSTVTATVAGGVQVRIREITDYPFKERVTFKIEFPDKKVKSATFPLRLRIPAWTRGTVLSINGTKRDIRPGASVFSIKHTWSKGDTITLEFNAEVETEQWYGGAWTLVRGPLVYALKMDEKWTWKPFEGTDRYYGDGAWEVTSDTPWNYCLMRDSFKAEDCVFTAADKLADYPWTLEDAPLSLKVPARTLPAWQAQGGNPGEVAYWTEDGDDTGDEAVIELIPYGCTTLRIAEFPTRIVPWDRELRRELFH